MVSVPMVDFTLGHQKKQMRLKDDGLKLIFHDKALSESLTRQAGGGQFFEDSRILVSENASDRLVDSIFRQPRG